MKSVISCVMFGVTLAATATANAASSPTSSTASSSGWRSEICGAAPSSECAAANFDQLVLNARHNNSYAIKTVYSVLANCAHAPTSQDAIAAAPVTAVGTTQSQAESVARSHLNSLYVACQNFTATQTALLPRFAWAAARVGYGPAQIFLYNRLADHEQAYTSGGNSGTVDSFLRVVDASAKAGSGSAQLVMSEAYREGVLVPADNVKAAAYYLAWNNKVNTAKVGVMPARLQAKLSTEQVAQAQQLAGTLTTTAATN